MNHNKRALNLKETVDVWEAFSIMYGVLHRAGRDKESKVLNQIMLDVLEDDMDTYATTNEEKEIVEAMKRLRRWAEGTANKSAEDEWPSEVSDEEVK